MTREQAERDRKLGELVRSLYYKTHFVSVENLLDGGCVVAHGYGKTRTAGELRADCDALDDAVAQAAWKAGIMEWAKALPPRDSMPTVDDTRPNDFRHLRGKG